jgi:RNA-binding protein
LIPRPKLRALIRKSSDTDATIWIGKSGLTSEIKEQIDRQLGSRELVKVKVHKTGVEDSTVNELAAQVAKDTASRVLDVRGRTFSLFRKKPSPASRG